MRRLDKHDEPPLPPPGDFFAGWSEERAINHAVGVVITVPVTEATEAEVLEAIKELGLQQQILELVYTAVHSRTLLEKASVTVGKFVP